MKRQFIRSRAAAVLTLGVLVSAPALASDNSFDASWQEGIRFSTKDGTTKIKFGGRAQNDWTFQSGNDGLLEALGGEVLEDGTEFRRMRLYVSGVIQKATIFKVQYDFAGGGAELKDAYVGLQGLPVIGTVRVGNQYEPIGLEEMTSSKYITFIERNLVTALSPARNVGILATNQAGKVRWAAGVFRESDDNGESMGDGEYAVTGRLSGTPLNADGGKRLLHIGTSVSYRNPTGGTVSYSQRPSVHLAPKYVNTGSLESDNVVVLGAEAAMVHGALSLQSEYLRSTIAAVDGSDPVVSGFYVFGSYFLTGEHRRYKSSSATFSRITPNRNFGGLNGGAGAWETAVRYSDLNLDDVKSALAGGRLNDVTLALNWYPNPNFRWMMNFVRAELEGAGVSNAFVMRFQTDF